VHGDLYPWQANYGVETATVCGGDDQGSRGPPCGHHVYVDVGQSPAWETGADARQSPAEVDGADANGGPPGLSGPDRTCPESPCAVMEEDLQGPRADL
jgi:hypothetical protein